MKLNLDWPLIAKVMHEAADIHLWDGLQILDISNRKSHYSCSAVSYAAMMSGMSVSAMEDLFSWLINLGCRVNTFQGFNSALEYPNIESQQAARYNWLKFAALIAEEGGHGTDEVPNGMD